MFDIENTWFISDLHLAHQGILTFERQQFKTIQEHDTYVMTSLKRWAKNHEGATLCILGDFGNLEKLRQACADLRYTYAITLVGVKGNHDHAEKTEYLEQMFDTYYTMPQYIHPRVIISHEPVWPCPAGVCNIHGHLHAAKLDSPQHINASICVANYQPIGWKTIQKMFHTIEKPNYKFLREPWREAYVFTQPKDDAAYDKKGKIKLKESIKLYNKKYGANIE